jgi:hypothetical protein
VGTSVSTVQLKVAVSAAAVIVRRTSTVGAAALREHLNVCALGVDGLVVLHHESAAR